MDDAPDPARVETLKRMTPAQKLQAVADLYNAEVRRRIADLRVAHPDWPDERLEHEARRSLLHSGT